jgi:predicted small lipoprotein YifL
MSKLLNIILAGFIILSLASCGVKGKLKSPAQIERIEAKKAEQEQKKAEEEAQRKLDKAKENPAPEEVK